jgi:hypothetical protein
VTGSIVYTKLMELTELAAQYTQASCEDLVKTIAELESEAKQVYRENLHKILDSLTHASAFRPL